jgi:hypothetical protein
MIINKKKLQRNSNFFGEILKSKKTFVILAILALAVVIWVKTLFSDLINATIYQNFSTEWQAVSVPHQEAGAAASTIPAPKKCGNDPYITTPSCESGNE